MNDFKKELIDPNVAFEKLKSEIESRIIKIKSPLFKIAIEFDEILKVIISMNSESRVFEIFDVTPETLDVTINKINEYVRGL